MTPATAAKTAGHRRKLRAPEPLRRVSGPRQGLAAPARPAPRPARRTPLPARAVRVVRSMPELPIVDRLVRGRAWIPLLGVMLAGIVAMQVELLKLNSSIGRAIDRGSALQSRNEQLRASVATLADDQRIERLAAAMGMVMPTPESVVFLAPRASDVQQAVAHMRVPDASVFAALQPTASTNLPVTAPAPAGAGASLGAGATSAATSTGTSTSASAGGATRSLGTTSAATSTGTSTSTSAGGAAGAGGASSTGGAASAAGPASSLGASSAGGAALPSRQSTSSGG